MIFYIVELDEIVFLEGRVFNGEFENYIYGHSPNLPLLNNSYDWIYENTLVLVGYL